MNQAVSNREQIQDIRRRFLNGIITRDQAKIESQPVIDAINARGTELAKKYKVRTGKVNFAQLMRG